MYGIIASFIGIFIISTLLDKYYKVEGIKRFGDVFFYTIFVAFIGARVVYAVMHYQDYSNQWGALFKISYYNLSLLGGILTALVVLFIWANRKGYSFKRLIGEMLVPMYGFLIVIQLGALIELVANPLGFYSFSKLQTLMMIIGYSVGLWGASLIKQKATQEMQIIINTSYVLGLYLLSQYI